MYVRMYVHLLSVFRSATYSLSLCPRTWLLYPPTAAASAPRVVRIRVAGRADGSRATPWDQHTVAMPVQTRQDGSGHGEGARGQRQDYGGYGKWQKEWSSPSRESQTMYSKIRAYRVISLLDVISKLGRTHRRSPDYRPPGERRKEEASTMANLDIGRGGPALMQWRFL